MATIIYPNTNGESYVNMGYGYRPAIMRSTQGLSKKIAVKTISIAAIEFTRGYLLSRYYPVVEIIPTIQGSKPKALALIKIDAISRRKKTTRQ